MEVWTLTTNALRRYDDFRQVVVDYAAAAKRHGAVYIEGIFSPIERHWRGVDLDQMFAGYCDGAQEARERHGVDVKLTPDITLTATSRNVVAGPVLVELEGATCWVPEGWHGETNDDGTLVLTQ